MYDMKSQTPAQQQKPAQQKMQQAKFTIDDIKQIMNLFVPGQTQAAQNAAQAQQSFYQSPGFGPFTQDSMGRDVLLPSRNPVVRQDNTAIKPISMIRSRDFDWDATPNPVGHYFPYMDLVRP